MSEIQNLKNENKELLEEINRLQKDLEWATYWNDMNNVSQIIIRVIKRGVIRF